MSDFIRQHSTTINEFPVEAGWVILSEVEAVINQKLKVWGNHLSIGISK